MNYDIRPWYHLLYVTDQIKSADQKAYLAIAVVCAVIGFSHQGFARIIHYLLAENPPVAAAVVLPFFIFCVAAGLIGTISEFYQIVFPKVKSKKYLKNRDLSAIFWNDVASMEFEAFRDQYMNQNREDDLVVQIYVLSKICHNKYASIGRLFGLAIFTIMCDVMIFIVSKIV